MERKATSVMMLTLLISMSTLTSNIQIANSEPTTIIVPDDYPTIQAAINAAVPTDTIYVRSGIYYENVVVNKTVSLIGENRRNTTIDAGGSETVVTVTVNSVNITGFTIQNGSSAGIHLETVDNCKIIDNIITNPFTAYFYGVDINESSNNIVFGNIITNNVYGIDLKDDSKDNVVSGNTIANNSAGIRLYYASTNEIYNNNFNNPQQVLIFDSYTIWDNGYPSGGNYWSDYTGTDLYSGPYQNEAGSDGIGDKPYVIDADNTDRYPLMAPYGPFSDVSITSVTPSKTVVGQGYDLTINITVANQGTYTETFNITAYVNGSLTSEQWETFWSMGDINRDGYINDTDADLLMAAMGSTPSDPNWNPNADLNEDQIVNDIDYYIWWSNYGLNIWAYFRVTIETQTIVNLLNGTSTTITFTWNTTGFAKGNYTISAQAAPVLAEIDTTDNTNTDGILRVTVTGDVNGDSRVDGSDLSDFSQTYGSTLGKPNWNPDCDLNNDNKVDIVDLYFLSKNYGKTNP